MTNLQTEYDKRGAWAMSASFDLHDCNPTSIKLADKIRAYVGQLLNRLNAAPSGDASLVKFNDPEENAGYAVSQLSETAIISGRFADKTNTLHLDILSTRYFDPEAIASFSEKYFEAGDAVLHYILRK